MNPVSPATLLRGLTVGGLMAAWAILAHFNSAATGPSDLSAALALAPVVAAIATALFWRAGNRLRMAAGGVATLAALAWAWPSLRQNVAVLYFTQHVSVNLALGVLFGRTLLAGRDPLVTQFARLAHQGGLSAIKIRYTRQVTIAWTCFFAAMATLSTFLFLVGPAAAWSVFANLLTMPLVLLMFAAEHLCRHYLLPPEERATIADTIRGYLASRRPAARDNLANDR